VYFLDGYNLLFSLTDSDRPLREQRQTIIRFLQKRFKILKIDGVLVFDGRVGRGEESGRSYPSPLEVVYTSKGQSADSYIEEQVNLSKNPRLITVVTNDRALIANVRQAHAKAIGNEKFIHWILKKKKKTAFKPDIADTKQNIERLLLIFEKKLEEEME